MNKYHYILLILLFPISIFSQTFDYKYLNSVKINPISFGQSEIQMHYEHYFNNRRSSVLIAPSLILRETDEESVFGGQVMGQWRLYVSHFNKEERKNFLGFYNYGFYAGVYGLVHTYQEKYTMYKWNPTTGEQQDKLFERNSISGELGPLMGLQIDLTKRIVLDFYLGGGIRYSEFEDSIDKDPDFENYSRFNEGVFAIAYSGVKPKLGLSIGINF